jgi:hypothetical protein
LFPTLIIERKAEFQFEASENKVAICFPTQVHGHPEILPWTLKRLVDPQLGKTALEDT